MYSEFPWNDIHYKPKNRVCEDFWYEFMRAARILFVIDTNLSDSEKSARNWREPDIYSVFDKLRQDMHNELPYNPKFVAEFDRSIEREVRLGRHPE